MADEAGSPSASKYRPKVSFYQDPADTDRMRGAVLHTMAAEGHRSLSEFIDRAVMRRVAELERRYNGGAPFPPARAGDLPQGRPIQPQPLSGPRLDVEDRWPELFAQLDATQRHAVRQSLASAWHDGWTPNREDVENLTDRARGAIDDDEYRRRARHAAERARRTGEPTVGD